MNIHEFCSALRDTLSDRYPEPRYWDVEPRPSERSPLMRIMVKAGFDHGVSAGIWWQSSLEQHMLSQFSEQDLAAVLTMVAHTLIDTPEWRRSLVEQGKCHYRAVRRAVRIAEREAASANP